ncbi:unnamed protein product, partial [Ascophyllum nodosum]
KPGSSALLVGSTKKGRGGWSTLLAEARRGKGRARRFRAPGGAEPLVIDMAMSRAFGRSFNRGEQQDAE